MTGATNERIDTVQRLIQSCHKARRGFGLAAEAAEDFTLKRLFNIYGQQRSRFAEELRQCTSEEVRDCADPGDWTFSARQSDRELLQACLDADEQSLQLYREAMQNTIPRKAHFLVLAQLSLMERVHERMHGLLRDLRPPGRVSVSTERVAL